MKIYARFDADGLPQGFYPGDIYREQPAGAVEISVDQWREFLSNQGYRRWDGASVVEYVPPVPPAPPFDALAYASQKRWEKEVGGIVVSGVPIATDDRSKLMIIGARVAAASDPQWSTSWAAADGNSYPVDAATMIAIADAVQAHVNSCFTTYADVVAAIGAGTVTTKEQIDAAFA